MEHHTTLSTELQRLGDIPRELEAVTAKELQARRDLVEDERRLAAAKNELDNAAREVEETTKTSRKVSSFFTGKSKGYKREAEIAERALVLAQEKYSNIFVVVEAQRVSIAEHGAKLVPLEDKVIQYEKLAGKLDEIYTEAVGPFPFPANDILTSAARTAQSELEYSQIAVLVERETMGHLDKALEAITKAVDEIARGNAVLAEDNSANSKVADAYRNAQNLAHEFRGALREARAINNAVTFAEEISIPRPPILSKETGLGFSVDPTADVMVWEQSQKSYKRDLLLLELFRSDEIARGELWHHAAESRVRLARSALLIVEQTVRERRLQAYEELTT